MGQFDQFANQGGPAAESADALAEARRKADEQLRTADYSGDLPEPLSGGKHAADAVTAAGEDVQTGSGTGSSDTAGPSGGPGSAESAREPAASNDTARGDTDGGDGGD